MDAKRIVIFVVLLVALAWAGQRACKIWRQYHPTPQLAPTTTPAPEQPPAAP